jgi:o-succinylbenzoate synthase
MIEAELSATRIEGRARGEVRRGVWISLAYEGHVAIGEASPLPGRSLESLEDVLLEIARLGSRVPIDLAAPMETVSAGLPASLRFALESASTQLARLVRGVPSPPTDHLETQVLGDDLDSIDRELLACARGARSFKLKIRSARDVWRVTTLRATARDARIRVDANRAFASVDDVPWDVLREARVEWIEEPTPASWALEGTPVPIALDESIEDHLELSLRAVELRHVAAVVLKPTLLGARGALAVADVARASDVRCVVSHCYESEIGRLAALELAHMIAPAECHGLARWAGIDSLRAEERTDAPAPLV